MRKYLYIIIIALIVLVNILVQWCFFRIDLTQDKRYSLSQPTKDLIKSLDDELTLTLYLDGDLPPDYARLQTAVKDLARELKQYGDVELEIVNPLLCHDSVLLQLHRQLELRDWDIITETEQMRDGSLRQMSLYPYIKMEYKNKQALESLFNVEGIEVSLAKLEYKVADAISRLAETHRKKIAFIEGHGELPEQHTYDCQEALARYFDIYRGQMTAEGDCLDQFAAVIIANPLEKFSDEEKYILDQYIMNGGSVLWLLSGVRLSNEMLTEQKTTPVIPLDLNITDLLFNYGVRINPRVVQDLQCSATPMVVNNNTQRQLMPFPYQPLLQAVSSNAITPNFMILSAPFRPFASEYTFAVSDVSFVGDGEGQKRQVLLATTTTSRLTPTPAEIDLHQIDVDINKYTSSYIPVAVSVEGIFTSLYGHLGKPDGVIDNRPTKKTSEPARQIFVACGGVAFNDILSNNVIPCGYNWESYYDAQISDYDNKAFIVSSLQYLTEHSHIKQKTIPLHRLDKQALQKYLNIYTVLVIVLPMVSLLFLFLLFFIIRKIRYTRKLC